MGYMDGNNRLTKSGTLPDALQTAADHTEIFTFGQRVRVHAVGVVVTTEIDGGAAAPVISFDKTSGATRGDADAGIITVPDNTVVNKVYRDTTSTIFPFTMEVGEFITPQVTTAATTAGGGLYFIEYEPIQDTDVNEANVTESA